MRKKQYTNKEIYDLFFKDKYDVDYKNRNNNKNLIKDIIDTKYVPLDNVVYDNNRLYEFTKNFVKNQLDGLPSFKFKFNREYYEYDRYPTYNNQPSTNEEAIRRQKEEQDLRQDKELYHAFVQDNNTKYKYYWNNEAVESLSDASTPYMQNSMASLYAIDIKNKKSMVNYNLIEKSTNVLGSHPIISSYVSTPTVLEDKFIKDGKEYNVEEIHLDDLFFDHDTLKVFKIDTPTLEKGYPTTDKGYLYIYNRRRKTRMTKFYLHSGGRMVDKPSTTYHAEVYWNIPSYPDLGHATLFDSVKPYNLDYSLLYLDEKDIFYDRYKNNISKVSDIFLNNTFRNKDVIYPEGKPSYNYTGNEYQERNGDMVLSPAKRNLSSEGKWEYDFPNYMIDQTILENENAYRYFTFDHNKNYKELNTKNVVDGSLMDNKYRQDILENIKPDFKERSRLFTTPTYKNSYLHLIGTTSIVIEDPDTVMQVYVTPKRTYIRNNADPNTLYRHTALKNNEYLFPKEGVLSDLPYQIFPYYTINGRYLHSSLEDVDSFNRHFISNESGYYFGKSLLPKPNGINPDTYKKINTPLLDYLRYSHLIGIDYNPNLKPNYVHFNGRPRPLFLNTGKFNLDTKVPANILNDFPFLNQTSDVVPYIPSNLRLPKGLIYTEFGFYRDGITNDTDLKNNIKSFNELFKIDKKNKIRVVNQRVLTSLNDYEREDMKEMIQNNFLLDPQHEMYTNGLRSLYSNMQTFNPTYWYGINDFKLGNIVPDSLKENHYKWNDSIKKFELLYPDYFLNGTGEPTYTSTKSEFVTTNKEKVVDIVNTTRGLDRSIIQPFLHIEGQEYIAHYGELRKQLKGYTTLVPTGDAVYYTYEDTIKESEIPSYLSLPTIDKYPLPYNGYNIEGEDLAKYLKLVYKGMSKSQDLDSNGFPKTIVGVETNYTYPIGINKVINLDTIGKMILDAKGESIPNDIGYANVNTNLDNWSFVSFMEKMKKGYPYSSEVESKLHKKHNMKWNKWTCNFYPDSDRHDDTNSNWRSNITKDRIRTLVESRIPDLRDLSLKDNSYFTREDVLDLTDKFYNEGEISKSYVSNIFGYVDNSVGEEKLLSGRHSTSFIFAGGYGIAVVLDKNQKIVVNSNVDKNEKYDLYKLKELDKPFIASHGVAQKKINILGDSRLPLFLPAQNIPHDNGKFNDPNNDFTYKFKENTNYTDRPSDVSTFIRVKYQGVEMASKESFINTLNQRLTQDSFNVPKESPTCVVFYDAMKEPREVIIEADYLYYNEKTKRPELVSLPQNHYELTMPYIINMQNKKIFSFTVPSVFNKSILVKYHKNDRKLVVLARPMNGEYYGVIFLKKVYWR